MYREHHGPRKPPRVCVIGAGISGLVCAKVLKGDGFEVTVFEKESAIGGVWAPTRTYPGLHTNNARETYCFSDHPYPDTADAFPSAEQVREYLRSYAERFQLISRIRLDTEVVRVARSSQGDCWEVTVHALGRGDTDETLQFDFVVICNGVFNRPNIPLIDGLERFEGKTLHSSEFTNPGLVRHKRVVVVGAGKSAIDCATWAAREARSSTLVCRRPHWMLPQYLFGFINTGRIFGARFIEFTMPYYRPRRIEALLHKRAAPAIRLLERGVLRLVRLNLRMPAELTPPFAPLAEAFETAGVVGDFFKLAREGAIGVKTAAIERIIDGHTLRLDTGDVVEADVLIFATGWRQGVPFLEDSIRQRIEKNGRFHLYRMIVPPEVPTLGLVGYNSSTACQLTSEVAANWLSHLFLARMCLPSVADMNADISRMHKWLDREMPSHRAGYFIGPFVSHYLDDLMRDMGLQTTRTSNFIAENLLPLWPARYSTVNEERQRTGKALPSARRFYLSGGHAAVAAGALTLAHLVWRWLVLSSFAG
jgi:cation diffusion facilitator CzcD-associated flavoprotein CzcO